MRTLVHGTIILAICNFYSFVRLVCIAFEINFEFFVAQFHFHSFLLCESRTVHVLFVFAELLYKRFHFKSRLSLIVLVNVVLNRTVVVDSD